MKLPKFPALFLAICLICLSTACGNDDETPTPTFISRMDISFEDSSGAIKAFTWRDDDGEGGEDPQIQDIELSLFTGYDVSIRIENNEGTDLSSELRSNGVANLFCFESSGLVPVFTATDIDASGLPIGLEAQTTTAIAGEGAIKITWIENPEKTNTNPCETGVTTLEFEFPVKIN